MGGHIKFKILVAAWLFRSKRADYYAYLADLIDATAGSKTLQAVFQDDAQRYSPGSARGKLSQIWLERFPQTGGDLFATWFGTLPTDDLLTIRSAQYVGADALTRTLRQLSEVVALVDDARSALFNTVFVGVIGFLLAVGSLFSIPIFTVSHLKKVFSAVPDEYFSGWTRALFATSDWLGWIWPYLILGLGGTLTVFLWSFPNWVGQLRDRADMWGPWAFYRRIQTVRFVSLLAVTLSPAGCYSARLRDAIGLQEQGATAWFGRHIYLMLTRLDLGAHIVDALDTGLVDKEIWWYFTDLLSTLGLDEALQRTRLRTQTHALALIHAQALFMRWGLLLFALSIVLGIAFWHVRVFEELRQALSLHYAR
jgi:hypothetical protein